MNLAKLRGAIAEAGLSAERLGKKVGMSKTTIHSRMQGRSSFRLDEVNKICEVLNITDPDRKAEIFLGECLKNETVKEQ